ncbi:MAG: xanthine dehydrogenase accessory protein XdhC [Leptothrix sp. (in: b-proteobacteria)]
MTPAALHATAERWLREGRAAMDVEVLAHRGSVPREAGTHMLVSADAVAGTIGGGHLELKAIAAARALLAERAAVHDATGDAPRFDATPVDVHYPLGPALGQCCGGAVTLRTAPLNAARLAGWPAAPPRFFLQLYGAGHVGRAIAALLAGIDCRVQWIDERESEFPPEPGPAHIERVCVDAVEAEVALAPPGAFYLVLTHQHELDLRITEAVLRRGDFGFLGLIGSATKRARFLHRYAERGIAPEQLARLTCPIGLPGIRGKEPEVLAISVVAQLLGLGAA